MLERYPEIAAADLFGVIGLHGTDVLDFLQRISTNDLSGLPVGGMKKTLLLSDKGRIIDAVWVVRYAAEVDLICSRSMTSNVIAFLEKYIIMDDVTVRDRTSSTVVQMQFGHSREGLQSDFFGHPVTFTLVAGAGDAAVTPKDFEFWRIMNGIPAAGKELVQDFNPLELNLWDWISFTKGCYIGQEVIARLDTYQKIQRTLCQFTTDGPAAEGDIVKDVAGLDVGRITSLVRMEDRSVGLAVIRRTAVAAQQQVNIAAQGSTLIIERVFHKEEHGTN